MFNSLLGGLLASQLGLGKSSGVEDVDSTVKEDGIEVKDPKLEILAKYGIDPDYNYGANGMDDMVIGIKGRRVATIPANCRFMRYMFRYKLHWITNGVDTLLSDGTVYCEDMSRYDEAVPYFNGSMLNNILDSMLEMALRGLVCRATQHERDDASIDPEVFEMLMEAVELANAQYMGDVPVDFTTVLSANIEDCDEFSRAVEDKVHENARFINVTMGKDSLFIYIDSDHSVYCRNVTYEYGKKLFKHLLEVYSELKYTQRIKFEAVTGLIQQCDAIILENQNYELLTRLNKNGTAMNVLFGKITSVHKVMNGGDIIVLRDGRVLIKLGLDKDHIDKYTNSFQKMEAGDRK